MSRARLHNLNVDDRQLQDLNEQKCKEEKAPPRYSFSCAEMNRLGLEYLDYSFLNELRNLVCSSGASCPALEAVSVHIIEGLEAIVSNVECFDAGLNFVIRCISELSEVK